MTFAGIVLLALGGTIIFGMLEWARLCNLPNEDKPRGW